MFERIESPSTRPGRRYLFWFWASVAMLFFLVNIGAEKYPAALMGLIDALRPHLDPAAQATLNTYFQQYGVESVLAKAVEIAILPTKASLFLLALVVIAAPLFKPVFYSLRDQLVAEDGRTAKFVFFLLFVFVFVVGTDGMGHRYQEMSFNPFDVETNAYYRRVLFPALSYYLHINGLLYTVFFWVAVYWLIRLCLNWFRQQGRPLSKFEALSLFSTGIVIYQYQYPGYVSFFVFILLLLSVLIPLASYQRASLFVLALATHETAAIAMMAPVVALFYPRREWPLYLLIVFLYGLFYLFNFGFDIQALLHAQMQLSDKSALELFAERPLVIFMGTLMAYKALWLYVALALFFLTRTGRHRDGLIVAGIVALPLLLLPIGVDTSRLAAFGFYGVMLAYVLVSQHLAPPYNRALLWVNLLLPSAYVAVYLDAGIQWFPGLYQIYPSLLQ